MEFSELVAGAVRAELARANKKPADLADVLGLSRPTIYGRISGAYPFTTAELEQVASFIGITAQDIMLSADLPQSFYGQRLSAVGPPSTVRVAAWAQPPGSSRRPQRL